MCRSRSVFAATVSDSYRSRLAIRSWSNATTSFSEEASWATSFLWCPVEPSLSLSSSGTRLGLSFIPGSSDGRLFEPRLRPRAICRESRWSNSPGVPSFKGKLQRSGWTSESDKENIGCCVCPWIEEPADDSRTSCVAFSLELTEFKSGFGYVIRSVF